MRRNLVWLVALLLAALGVARLNQAPARSELYLCLMVSPDRFQRDFFTLTVSQSSLSTETNILGGQVTVFGPQVKGTTTLGTATAVDDHRQAQLISRLEQAGIWRLGDGDSGDPESQVLYTTLAVDWSEHHSRTRWRGLPPAQGRIAQALMGSPIGPQVLAALDRVQARKLALARQPVPR